VRRLYERGDLAQQQDISTEALAVIFRNCIEKADEAMVADTHYLRLLGCPSDAYSAAQLWRRLLQPVLTGDGMQTGRWVDTLETIMRHGPLARRIQRAVQAGGPRNGLEPVYRRLCACLGDGHLFIPNA
jgi:carboxylate-amine ligase